MKGKLFVLATPLGNLGDLSPRAAEVLRQVDVGAAEDPRRSRTLLNPVDLIPAQALKPGNSREIRLSKPVDRQPLGTVP